MEGSRVATIGAALADPSRSEILAALASGRAHTAGELAQWAGLAASTTSAHLSRLVDAGLVAVEPSGRHRYFRIASDEVAELLERIDSLDLSETNAPRRPHPGSAMSFARTCYDHLAGELGVQLHTALVAKDLLTEEAGHLLVTKAGRLGFAALDIDTTALSNARRPVTRQCLDWTQRRHHLGGALGAALLEQMLASKWLKRGRDERVISLTPIGGQALRDHFGLTVAPR